MNVTETISPTSRSEWRSWLNDNHATKDEIWILAPRFAKQRQNFTYLESVLEALCFGWIDGIAKTYSETQSAQRFTPRRKGSNWTELNKERCRRLITEGLMTSAGLATLPDLDIASFRIPSDIEGALRADPQTWANFEAFDGLYQRIRVGYVEDQRKQPAEFEKRLARLVEMTAQNKQFGGTE